MFFSFLAVFPLPESYQNDPKFHFNTLLRSDTQKSSKNVENTTVFWSRCETVFGPPAKADIATAILTNVIEHLVLLFCPPISTPSPPKRCGRIFWVSSQLVHEAPSTTGLAKNHRQSTAKLMAASQVDDQGVFLIYLVYFPWYFPTNMR